MYLFMHLHGYYVFCPKTATKYPHRMTLKNTCMCTNRTVHTTKLYLNYKCQCTCTISSAKISVSFISFSWYCHFDDDIYVNTAALIQLTQKYDHRQDQYLGKWKRLSEQIYGNSDRISGWVS